MKFEEQVRDLLRATELPPEFRWSFRNDGVTTLHYGHRNVVLELEPKPTTSTVHVRQRSIEQRAPRDEYPELAEAGRFGLEELTAYLGEQLAPFHGAQGALL